MGTDEKERDKQGEQPVKDLPSYQSRPIYAGKNDPRKFGTDSGFYRGFQQLLRDAAQKGKEIQATTKPGLIEFELSDD